MKTILVWVLVVYHPVYPMGRHEVATVVDDIASERNCRGLGDVLARSSTGYTCVAVRKVVR